MYKEYLKGEAPEILERLATLFRRADAFVIVSAEYNHSIPPGLSNTLDHFLEEYFWRPSAIVCYSGGQFGGVRAAMQLRAMLCELGMPSISSLLPIPKIGSALDPEGSPRNPGSTSRPSASLTNSFGTRKRSVVSGRKARPTEPDFLFCTSLATQRQSTPLVHELAFSPYSLRPERLVDLKFGVFSVLTYLRTRNARSQEPA
jgi:NAD(P)H-dependent FMN reductase